MQSLSKLRTNACGKCLSACSSLHVYKASECPDGGCDACNALTLFDTETSTLEDELTKRSDERRKLKTTINSRHDRLQVHAVPLEIVGKIFQHYVEDNIPRYQGSHDDYRDEPVLILGAVCRQWREFTLSSPRLWSSFKINLWKNTLAENWEVTQEWIQRSSSTSLFLTVKAPDPPPELTGIEQERVLDNFVKLIGPHLGRWHGLNLQSSPRMTRIFLNKLKQAPQELDSLDIIIRGIGMRTLPGLSMEGEFNPKDLFVESFSLLATVPLKFDRLTDLRVIRLPINELLTIIRKAPNLCTLRASCITRAIDQLAFTMSTDFEEDILHRALMHLDIESSQNNEFIRHITLPSLQSLRYTFQKHEDQSNGLCNFLARSGSVYGFSSLSELSFTYKIDVHDNPYVDGNWYGDIPSLSQLHIQIPLIDGKSEDDILLIGERLLHPLDAQRDPLVFPLLKQFRITAPRLSSTSWSHLSKMLRPASVQEENSMSAASNSVNEQRVRFLDRISVRLTSLMETDDFFKPGIGISKDDCVRFLQTDQKSKVCIDFKAEPNSQVDLLLKYCKIYKLIPAENEADEWV